MPGAGPAPTPKPAAGGNFRETLWFKKGDVDQMVADARARVEAARAKGVAVSAEDAEAAAVAEVAAPEEGAKPLDERYVDDGSVTVEDRKKFSLRSGATATSLPAVGGAVPGERMSDAEVMGEIGGKKKVIIIVIAAVVAILVGIVVVKKFMAKDVAKSAEALTPSAIPTEPAAPPAPPTPAPPPPAAGKAPEPVKEAVKEAPAAKETNDEEAAPKAASSHSSGGKKHVVAKKAKGKKAHK
jgi:hypothetical protein